MIVSNNTNNTNTAAVTIAQNSCNSRTPTTTTTTTTIPSSSTQTTTSHHTNDDEDDTNNHNHTTIVPTTPSPPTPNQQQQQSPSILLSHSLQNNLLQKHYHIDPMDFYTIEAVLGEGSMGFVAKVIKNDTVRGGSARPNYVQKYHHSKNHIVDKVCFCIPLTSLFCPPNDHHNDDDDPIPNMKGTLIDIPEPSSSSSSLLQYDDNHTSFLTSSGLSIVEPSRTTTMKTTMKTDNPKTLSHQQQQQRPVSSSSSSSMISYGTKKHVPTYYALKSILLDRCSTPELKQELKNEVDILQSLDHPNIVRAYETFDYRGRLYIVMELCNGKDLYSRDPYTEIEAQRIMTSLFEAISYLHTKGIVHRDIKYENIMFVDDTPNAEIRLIDFGLSQKFVTGEHLHALVGTVYTMAPELIQGDYNDKADIWSLGVIAFMLLSSSMPFYGESREEVIDHILHGKYKFQSKRWQHVSNDAKDFVVSLLRRRPEKRPTAYDALHKSVWLSKEDLNASTNTLTEIDRMDTIQASIQAFAEYKTLKKLALLVVAYKSTNEEIGFLRKMFHKFDTSNDGEITYDEFRTALLENYDYTESDIASMFTGMDIDGMGKVHYMEFLAATIEAHGTIDEERLAESFDRLDTDDSGIITVQNLKDFLGDELSDTYLERVLNEAHSITTNSTEATTNDDTKNTIPPPTITYDEFLQLWDFQADLDRQTAQQTVNAHRLIHTVSSTFSTISSTLSDDGDDNNNSATIDHDGITGTKTTSTTGCNVFQDEHRKSITNIIPLYGDV